MKIRIFTWVRFLRLPNAFTVPGDIWAGALAQTGTLEARLHPFLGVLAAYLFGMALNDLWDLPRDRDHRPERPLPSGGLTLRSAWITAGVLAVLALMMVPSISMGALLASIVAYTLLKERVEGLGPPLMGLCRALVLWIGAGSPADPSLVLLACMVTWVLWVWMVTGMARNESDPDRGPGRMGWGLRVSMIWFPLWVVLFLPNPWWALPFLALLVGGIGAVDAIWRQQGWVEPATIGRLLRLLIPMQSAVIAGCGRPGLALGLLPVWPLLAWISRRFPMS